MTASNYCHYHKLLLFGSLHNQGCFLKILQYGHTCNHSQEDLAKFGYRPDMKVNNNNNIILILIIIFSLPAGTCYTNLEGFFFNFWEIRVIFQKSNHTFEVRKNK